MRGIRKRVLSLLVALAFILAVGTAYATEIPDNLKSLFANSAVAYIGNPAAYVKGQQVYISADRTAVPVVRGGNVLLPVDFAAECLGAAVQDDAQTGYISIVNGSTAVKIKTGEKGMFVNDRYMQTDVMPVEINKEVYYPIGTLAWLFGKKVVWQGNIVIVADKSVKIDDSMLLAVERMYNPPPPSLDELILGKASLPPTGFVAINSNEASDSIFKPEYKTQKIDFRSFLKQPRTIAVEYPYSYRDLELDLLYLYGKYPGVLKMDVVGYSAWGQPIYAVTLGKGTKKVMINAEHHAREYATTAVVMKMLSWYLNLYESGASVQTYGSVRKLLDQVAITFIPAVNPDGLMIAQNDWTYINSSVKANLSKLLVPGAGFVNWKSDGLGIDINENYPARWQKGNYVYASEMGRGRYPGEAPEAAAMMNYTKKQDFLSTISYHDAGQAIYWYFWQDSGTMQRDYSLTKQLSALTGYWIVQTAYQKTSYAGYKDWFVQTFRRPAWTVEIGQVVDGKPLAEWDMLKSWEKNKYVGLWLAKTALQLH